MRIENKHRIKNGCTTFNCLKALQLSDNGKQALTHVSIFKDGTLISVLPSYTKVLDFIEQNEQQGSVLYARMMDKLIIFKEYKQQPIFFNGFNHNDWSKYVHHKALVDYDNHTPKEVTLKYEAITHALEQLNNPQL